jgi:transcriptional regulator with XRE-family HTH domain
MDEADTVRDRARVALLVRSVRERRGLSVGAAADRTGVQPQTIARVERGEADVHLGTLLRYLRALSCSLDLLVVDDATGEVIARCDDERSTG